MSRKLVSLMTLIVFLSVLGVAVKVQSVKASGTIYIRADGSVDPPTAPIFSVDNVTYIFTDNINDSVVVERSNIIIDGAGYTAQGRGGSSISSVGICLCGVCNVTTKNTNIKEFFRGVHLISASNNTFSGSKIISNYYGFWLSTSSNNTISGNEITNNGYTGVLLAKSSNNTISENNITSNDDYGIYLSGSSNCNAISGNNITSNEYIGILLSRSSNINISGNMLNDNKYGFSVWGDELSHFTHSVDVSNLVDAKPVHYLVNQKDLVMNPATHPQVGHLALINCANVTVEGLTLKNNGEGVLLSHTNNSRITATNITNNDYGVCLYKSSNNTISGNEITNNGYTGVLLAKSSNNTISENNITNNVAKYNRGVWLSGSSNYNAIFGNNITNNSFGVYLRYSSNNRFYHNNLINNTEQVYVETSGHSNFWDNGLEGNYWSDYVGFDLDRNGIGDSAYEIDADNIDNYPMMGIFSDFSATSEYHVKTICNSSLSDFQFNGTAICFNVTGENDTIGFCRICIPRALINETYEVFVNGTEVLCNLLPCSNTTHSYLYFTYNHSTKEVIIIPEFPSFLILPLFILATLLAVIVYKRKHQTRNKKREV